MPVATADLSLLEDYQQVRAQTMALIQDYSPEDLMLQSMPDASPGKWHLAHTTWFFETFLLEPKLSDYQVFDPAFCYLFNSYYETVGDRHPRPERGLLSRPSLDQVLAYRSHVDKAVQHLLTQADAETRSIVIVGLQHEMQHQELIQTDLKHALSLNPYNQADTARTQTYESPSPLKFVSFDGGLTPIGADAAEGFSYDCERPRHQVWLEPFAMANRLVTNAEWLEFMQDGGYETPQLWLADGWATLQQKQWRAPLYWHDGQPDDLNAPVRHISYYEADAFARWAGARLPTEFEWEHAVTQAADQFQQLFDEAWQWTQSPFLPYPGFVAEDGALGEYNGKFMANQWVLRGGSLATATAQTRTTYRNFFYAHQRWQFTSLRIAKQG